ncbi:hypothetical protein WV34_06500 [Bacillus amyloliquefaciens]|nr:hypothetical protein WV34_06500 [Bacillus amyloliquefaciens]
MVRILVLFQYENRPEMKATLSLIGAIISFPTAAYFKYIEKRKDKCQKRNCIAIIMRHCGTDGVSISSEITTD